jgi:alkaline phosphatase
MKKIFLYLFFLSTSLFSQEFRVHSHNDYAQDVPFWKAFKAGCASIEADLILKKGELYVAHNEEDIKDSHTFELLYLKPLKAVLKDDANSMTELQLLLDIKTEAKETLKTLMLTLDKYPSLVNNKKIKFVISGNRPAPEEYKLYPSYLSFDYQTVDIWPADWNKIALVSLPFYKYSFWNGKVVKDFDAEKFSKIIQEIHAQNKRVRFWATPDTELAWKTFYELGIDFINTDHPDECVKYLDGLTN